MPTNPFNITPNCIKAVALGSTEAHDALRPYNSKIVLGLNDVGYGTTTELGFWNGKTPPDGGYVVYIPEQATTSTISTKIFYNDFELIQFATQSGVSGTTIYDAITGLINLGNLVMSYNLPDFPLNNNLVFSVFSGITQSLPNSFSGLTTQWKCMGSAAFTTFDNYFTGSSNLTMDADAVIFDGTLSCTIDSAANIPVGNSDYSIVVWFYPTAIGGGQGLVGWGSYGNNNEVNALRLDGDNLLNYWWANDLNATALLENNTWYCVVATYNSATNTRSIYLDGTLLDYDNPTGTHAVPTASNLTIGVTNSTEYFTGLIQNVAVYNIALDLQNVRNYYYSTLPLIGGANPTYNLLTNPALQNTVTESNDYINVEH